MLQSEHRATIQNSSDTKCKRSQALAVKENHFETTRQEHSVKNRKKNPQFCNRWEAAWRKPGESSSAERAELEETPRTCLFNLGPVKWVTLRFPIPLSRKKKKILPFFILILFAQCSNKWSGKTSSFSVHRLWDWFSVMLRLPHALTPELKSHHVNERSPHHKLGRTNSGQPQKSEWVVYI